MFGEAITIGKTVFSALQKPFRAGARRVRIWSFRVRTRKPPLSEVNAEQIAYSVLAGDILRAIAFRNIDSPHVFIACLRRSSERDFDFRAYALEQTGNTFRTVWKSDILSSATPMAFEVQDVDDDGNREIVFEDKSYGTGGGSYSLMIYSTSTSRLFSLTESLNWQNRAGPTSPEIEIKPADTPEMVRVLEDIAKRHGFLQPGRMVDFESPEFSVQRWHKENGTRTSGLVSIHHYEGYPRYEATVAATLV